MMKYNLRKIVGLKTIIVGLFLFTLFASSQAATGNWASIATGGNIVYTTTDPTAPLMDASGKFMTVVYLENLGFTKLGGNTNETNVAWLLSQGYRVIELNYAGNTNAVSPAINADIIAINDAIFAGSFCGLTTCSQYRSYVLFEGYRISRDVSYFKDDPTIYNYATWYTEGDSLYMDIIYPANTTEAVPVVLSFSYSNSYPGEVNKNQRLNLGNTLAGFNDSFLEGAPANGIAWAIADHPKYCTWGNGKPVGATNNKAYASYETNPDAAQKVKSAIRTLRTVGTSLGLSGKIGIYGFSRGSDAGSLAVGDKTVANFENAGLNIGVSDDVQVAALGSGVFDFTYIYNTIGDGDSNLETNCPSAWGPLASNLELWKTQGSYYLAQSSATAPVIFFYNTDDALYYRNQIMHFKARLDSLGVPTSQITNYGTAHAVPQTAAPLTTLYSYFKQYLTPPNVTTNLSNPAQLHDYQISIFPNPAVDKLKLTFNQLAASKVKIELWNLSGIVLFKTEKMIENIGLQTETIELDRLNLPQGIYYVKVVSDGIEVVNKFIKK